MKYEIETANLVKAIGQTEIDRLYSYPESELEPDFLGFLNSYYDLQSLPTDFTIIDFGCYQAVQGYYFRNHKKYIGIDADTPTEYMLKSENATYYLMLGQEFIKNILPKLNLRLDKVFAICSYVPDKELEQMVWENFKYHRVIYTNMIISENLPR